MALNGYVAGIAHSKDNNDALGELDDNTACIHQYFAEGVQM